LETRYLSSVKTRRFFHMHNVIDKILYNLTLDKLVKPRDIGESENKERINITSVKKNLRQPSCSQSITETS